MSIDLITRPDVFFWPKIAPYQGFVGVRCGHKAVAGN